MDGHGHPIDTSLLPLKKRASNYSGGGGRISGGDPHESPSKKKKRMDDNNLVGAETQDTAGALEAPVPRQRRRPVPREPAAELASPAADSPEPAAAKGNALLSESDQEKKRVSKGKWLAKEETIMPPPAKKLMHDGIRSFVPQQLRDDEHRRHAAIAVPPPHGSGASPALSPALERRLAELGATRPWLVHSKRLQKSDVDENQNRLLVSCKRSGGSGGGTVTAEHCPITRCFRFSPAELARVNNKLVGLRATALDRDGSAYALTCKFLRSNSGYRFIHEWKDFLARNGMNLSAQKGRAWARHVEVELWAFRSQRLPFQPRLDAEGDVVKVRARNGDGKAVEVEQQVSHHLDPDGALGFVLLYRERPRRAVVKSEEEDDDDWDVPSPPPSAARRKGKQRSDKKRGASASTSAFPARVAEPTLSFCAAIGLEKLRRAILKRRQASVDQGRHGAKGFSSNGVAKSSADVEGERIKKKRKSPGTHSIKERGASGGRKSSTEDMVLS